MTIFRSFDLRLAGLDFGLVWFGFFNFARRLAVSRCYLVFFFTEFFYDVNPFVFFCFVSGFAPSLIELFSFIRQLDRF